MSVWSSPYFLSCGEFKSARSYAAIPRYAHNSLLIIETTACFIIENLLTKYLCVSRTKDIDTGIDLYILSLETSRAVSVWKMASVIKYLRHLHSFIYRRTSVEFPTCHFFSRYVVISKAIPPLESWTGPESSRRLRLPDLKTVGTWRW